MKKKIILKELNSNRVLIPFDHKYLMNANETILYDVACKAINEKQDI